MVSSVRAVETRKTCKIIKSYNYQSIKRIRHNPVEKKKVSVHGNFKYFIETT